ncbi:MAG TPA: isocitrate lyase/phosphoenolpyruvate mutase family protein [Candidatus Methylomirabilis sp.]|nr:isocitrate lyase/phosphoenolpyruvate mutase family protein [Candidatus Methylomirabilis sp.]
MSKAKKLRELFTRPGLVRMVGAHDGLGAKLVERAGFDGVWSSSLEVSASHGIPDASLLSMTQYLEAARSMVEVTSIPVVVDGDTGYGNANNVFYTVERFEEAGVAGITFEDKKFPKDNSLLPGGRQALAGVEEFAGKIEAAKAAQHSPDFVVIARVEALIAGWGHEEAHRRASRYVEAGADAILIHSKAADPKEIIEFVTRWEGRAPLVLVPTMYPSLTEQRIQALGKVKMVIYANHGLRAAIRATEEVLAKIRQDGGIHDLDHLLVPMKHVFDLQDVPKMKEREQRFLRD